MSADSARTRAEEIQAALASYGQAAALNANAEQYEQRRGELEERRTALESHVITARLLLEYECMAAERLPDVGKERDSLAKIRKTFEESPENLRQGNDYKHLLKGVEDISQAVETTTTTVWKGFLRDSNPVKSTILKCVELLNQESLNEEVASVRELLERFKASPPPTSSAAFASVVATAEKLKERYARIEDKGSFPAEVRTFLEACRQQAGGAPLGLLTETVRTWLVENDMERTVRVRLVQED